MHSCLCIQTVQPKPNDINNNAECRLVLPEYIMFNVLSNALWLPFLADAFFFASFPVGAGFLGPGSPGAGNPRLLAMTA